MVSLGQFSYDLTISNQQALQALTAVQQQAKATQATLQGGSNKFVLQTDQATAALVSLTKAATAAAAAISKPVKVNVDTSQAQSALQKFSGGIASGLGFGTGAAVAVKGIDLVTDALKGAVEGGLKYNAQLETATQTLELFTGSSVQAQQALTKLRAYADFTPFNTDEVIQGGQAFIKSVNGDISAMEKLVHLAGQLAATNPDRSAGGGFESATVALREVLGGQTESIAERFNIPRSTIQSLKDAGLEGVALAEALVKAAHGSEELVNKLSTSATGQVSNFTSALQNLEQQATKPIFDELTKGLKGVNAELSRNSGEYANSAAGLGSFVVGTTQLAILYAENSPFVNGLKTAYNLLNLINQLGGSSGAQRNASLTRGGTPITSRVPTATGTSTEDPYADNIGEAQRLATKYVEEGAAKRKALAEKLSKDLKEIESDTTRDALKNISDQEKAVRDGASEKKKSYDETRDAAIRAIDQETQAYKDGVDQQVRALEVSRDRQNNAAEAGHQAAIRGIEAEQQATERARTQQDRARESEHEAILRGAEVELNTRLGDLDKEKNAIEQRRDAALRALDEESRAEDLRHRDALANIDRELNAKLGILNKELDAISAQGEKASRAATDRSLSRALSDAKNELKNADTKEQKARAQRAVDDAEYAIQRERDNRARQDAQQVIRDRIEAARAEAKARQDIEAGLHVGETQNIAVGKETVRDTAAGQLDTVKAKQDEEKKGYADLVQSINDTYKAETLRIADTRQQEDDAFAARKRSADDYYDAQKKAIDAAFNDPETGSIPTLKRQAEAAEREFARQKLAANDAYDAQTKALEKSTDATIKDLERQKDAWTKWKEHIEDQIREAGTDLKKLRDISLAPPPGTSGTQNAGHGSGEPPSRGNIPASLTTPSAEVLNQAKADGALIGENVSAGLGEGVNSEASQAVVKGSVDSQINTNVIAEAKGLLGIASPSTVFDQFGQDTAQGFADGFAKVDLAHIINDPFNAEVTVNLPNFVGAMTKAGTDSATGFQTNYETVNLGVIINSPFDAEVTTNLPNFVDAMGKAGTNSAAGFINGFKAKDLPNVLYREGVYDVIKEFQSGYESWFNTGANSAQSFVNGFGWVLSNWKPFGSSSASGSGEDPPEQRAIGGPLNVGRLTMVGERGPELIVPHQAGEVLPADVSSSLIAAASGHAPGGVGGSSSYQFGNINITIDGADQNAAQIISKAGPAIVQHVVQLLDIAHRDTAQRMNRSLPGAD